VAQLWTILAVFPYGMPHIYGTTTGNADICDPDPYADGTYAPATRVRQLRVTAAMGLRLLSLIRFE
jgi:hypothetical protein